jgi:hypothetical protein
MAVTFMLGGEAVGRLWTALRNETLAAIGFPWRAVLLEGSVHSHSRVEQVLGSSSRTRARTRTRSKSKR